MQVHIVNILTGDCVESFINQGNFITLLDTSFKYDTDKKLTIKVKREDDASLLCTIEGQMLNFSSPKLGTVHKVEDHMTVSSPNGKCIRLSGMLYIGKKGNSNHEVHYFKVARIDFKGQIKSTHKEAYFVEWLDNLSSNFIYPDYMKIEKSEETKVSFDNSGNSSLSFSQKESNYIRNCINLEISKIKFILIMLKDTIDTYGKKGLIFYQNPIDESLRKKIRWCLSFLLGRPLVCIGYGIYNENYQLISFEAVTPDTNLKSRTPTLPPAPLDKIPSLNSISSEVLNTLIGKLINKYDEYDLEYIFSLYWLAINAHEKVKATIFGSCIEQLIKHHLANTKEKSSGQILSSEKWKSLTQCIKKVLTEEEYDQIKNKFGYLNEKPIKNKINDACESLGFELSKEELEAWKQRNDASHGNKVKQNFEKIKKTIEANKRLKMIFHKMLLSISDINEYIDYASNHVIRSL